MANGLVSKDELAKEHQQLFRHTTSLSDIAVELEQMDYTYRIEKSFSRRMEEAANKLHQLERLLASLKRGVEAHMKHEEEGGLISFFQQQGFDNLNSILLAEHREILSGIRDLQGQAKRLNQQGLAEEELSLRKKVLKEALAVVIDKLKAHAGKEEEILWMMDHGS